MLCRMIVRTVKVRVLFWHPHRPSLKTQDKILSSTRTRTSNLPQSPGSLLFWAPDTRKALKMHGDRRKDGPPRAFVTRNCYGKMAHRQAGSPGKPSLLRAVVATSLQHLSREYSICALPPQQRLVAAHFFQKRTLDHVPGRTHRKRRRYNRPSPSVPPVVSMRCS